MIIELTKRDAMVLVLVMDGMRKAISVNTRENNGIIKGKQMMKTYKNIIKTLEDQLIDNQDASDDGILDYEFTMEQSEMTKEFLSTYMELLAELAKSKGMENEKHPYFQSLQNCVYALLIAEDTQLVGV